MSNLAFGLIGTGFMGRAHAIALAAVGTVYDDIGTPRRLAVADLDRTRALAAARELGFDRGVGDWREIVEDPTIDVVDICAPNHLHFEMAQAALLAGKHVYCEKPLALDAEQCRTLAELAARSDVVHAVGLNYTANPLIREARRAVVSAEIGEPIAFSGRYFEDYMARPEAPFSWRCARELAGAGALNDLGSHLINLVRFLVGEPRRVLGDVRTVIRQRHDPSAGTARAVENDDLARAFLDFDNGLTATLEISRVAFGHKCGLTFELFGTRGSLAFNQERMNELRLYEAGQRDERAGYKTLLAGPHHGDYGRFCPAPGHGLGINDLKVIEIHDLIRAIDGGAPVSADFAEGFEVQRVIEAIEQSSGERTWCDIAPTDPDEPEGAAS